MTGTARLNQEGEAGNTKGRDMLCLTRKPGQSLAIGGDITVTVLEISRQIVRLGIEAPKERESHGQ